MIGTVRTGFSSLLRGALLLSALLAGGFAWANGDHPMRLPPPDAGPALAQIEAEARAAPPQAVVPPAPAVSAASLTAVAREAGHAIFSPFSETAQTTSTSTATATAVSNLSAPPATTPGGDLSLTALAGLAGIFVGWYMWRRTGV